MDLKKELLASSRECETFFDASLLKNRKDYEQLADIYPAATEETANFLIQKIRLGDANARDLLVKTSISLILSVADQLKNRIALLNEDEMLSAALSGLYAAIEEYDTLDEKTSFIAFAQKRIKKEIADENALVEIKKLLKDEQIGTETYEYLTANCFEDFVKIVKKYPVGNTKTNAYLYAQYKKGNERARDLLVMTNIRFVIYMIKKYQNAYIEADLVQEGILGLLEAIETYDESKKVTFLTHAYSSVHGAISKAFDKITPIHLPAGLQANIRNYKKKVDELTQEGRIASIDDESMAKELNMTANMLDRVKKASNFTPISLDAKIQDEDGASFQDMIPNEDISLQDVLSQLSNKSLLLYLKTTLSPYRYYLLYRTVICQEPDSKVCQIFGVSRQAVNLRMQKTYKELKKLYKDGTWNYKLENIANMDDLNVEPLNPERIIQYLFLRNILTKNEAKFMKVLIAGKYVPDSNSFMSILGFDMETYYRVKEQIKGKLDTLNDSLKESYEYFKSKIIERFHSNIFDIDLDIDLDGLDVKCISSVWEIMSYSEILSTIQNEQIVITPQMGTLLGKYFESAAPLNATSSSLRAAEREVNSVIFGYKKTRDLNTKKLYETLIANKEAFTNEQKAYLLMARFGKINREYFTSKYPNSSLLNGGGVYVINRLEEMYFDVANYRELNCTKEKYLAVREQCASQLQPNRMKMLDMFYGIEGRNHTIQQIADEFHQTYDDAKDTLSKAKRVVLSAFLDKRSTKTIDQAMYVPYVEDESYDIKPANRTVLKKFLIEGKTYEEIADELKITRRDVSNNFLEGIMKIDYYRFGILQKKISKDEQKSLLEKTEISEEDIEREVTAHPSALILNENERLVLAELYGIKCNLNPTGLCFDATEFKRRHPALAERLLKLKKSGLEAIAKKKAGLIRATLDYVDRATLNRSLKDPRLPISDKERELLSYTYELSGYQYETLAQLETIYGDKSSSLKRRIQRAIVTIAKYENGELPGQISYEEDVMPNLKYFARSDCEILTDLYSRNMTYDEIAKAHDMTYSQVEKLVFRLDSHLRDLLDGAVRGFDFDYFWNKVDDEDVPFYGDKEKAKRLFFLYYEKRMTIEEIIDYLSLEVSASTVQRTISLLRVAVLKRREGIKKSHTFSFEEIRDYYLAHCDTMDREQKNSYTNYFRKAQNGLDEKIVSASTQANVNPVIIFDLIKANNRDYFDINSSDSETVKTIIRGYHKQFSENTIDTLIELYGIQRREIMSGSEQKKVLRFLANVKK